MTSFEPYAQQALHTTRLLIDRFGARLAGSSSCLAAAQVLQQELHAACGQARLEEFSTHPGAFMGFYKINTGIYLICVLFLHLKLPLLAAAGFSFLIISGFLEFGYYKEFFDPLFPKKTCTNLVTTLEPAAEPRQQIILSGHHDSAQELNYMRASQKLYGLKILVPDVVYTIAFGFTWFWSISQLFTGQAPAFTPILVWFITLGFFLVVQKFFMVNPQGTPGAGDNLIASAMLVELARIFAIPGQTGRSALQHTRLLLVSFDAEESGLRGSRAFTTLHRSELCALPTFMLNIDSIYNVNEIQFLTTDLNGTISLSKDLAERCARLAGAAGYPQKLTRMVFGGGGTDAAELSRAGVQATTMLAMPTSLVRDGLVYHTMRDTADAIEPEAVEACLQIARDLVLALDQNA